MERLALDGGTPVRKTMLNYARQWVDQDDIEAVVKALKGDWLTTGPSVREFEDAVAAYTGARSSRCEHWDCGITCRRVCGRN